MSSSAFGLSPDAPEVLARELLTACDLAHASATRLRSCAFPTAGLQPHGQLSVAGTAGDVERLGAELTNLSTRMAENATRIRQCGDAYLAVEQMVAGVLEFRNDVVAIETGTILRAVAVHALVAAVPLALVAAGAALAAVTVAAGVFTRWPNLLPHALQALGAAQSWLDQAAATLPRTVTAIAEQLAADPRVVAVLAAAVESFDEFVFAFLGVPVSALSLLPDDVVAHVVLAGIVLPVLGQLTRGEPYVFGASQGSAEAVAVPREPDAPATSLAAGFRAIVDPDMPDVVVNEYLLADGTTRYQVFVQGTEEFAMGTSDTALDQLSNIENSGSIATATAGTGLLVEQAMTQAGVPEGAQVDLYGYSQGGAAVALVAARGTFNVQTLTTYGAPAGRIEVPSQVSHLALQHSDDIVPALGGSYDSSNAHVITLPSPNNDGTPFYAHLSEAYTASSELIDRSDDSVVNAHFDRAAIALRGAQLVDQHGAELVRP